MEFARGQFELNAPQGDGATLFTHLRRLAANTGQTDPRLHAKCPPGAHAVWQAFNTMGRPAGDGFTYLTQAEVAAYQANYRIRLTPWELDAIRALDSVAASVAAKHQKTA